MLTLQFPDKIEDGYCDSDNNQVKRDANGQCVVDPDKVRLPDFLAIGFTIAPPVVDPAPEAAASESGAAA